MTDTTIYQDIETRTGGDIYIGVVGPVRTGKSTFIKKFMETLVIPNIDSTHKKERAQDELPQSAAGRTIMTTEPKFIPEEAVKIELPEKATLNVRLIDCVGYIVPSSLGYIENEQPRMVKTPWFDDEIPFNMAAELGTQKVITEHSTIGLVITTDGTISEIPREEYQEAEERVIKELKEINKPFVMILNSAVPDSQDCVELSNELSDKYSVPVIAVNCLEMTEKEIVSILSSVLYRFPVSQISVEIPSWVMSLEREHWLRSSLCNSVKEASQTIKCVSDIGALLIGIEENEFVINEYNNNYLLNCLFLEIANKATKLNATNAPYNATFA